MKIALLAGLCIIILASGCQKEIESDGEQPAATVYKLQFNFKNKVAAQALTLGNTYTNPFNEPYTITAFKYYISNISLQLNNEAPYKVPGIYHLVDEAQESSKTLLFEVPKKQFNRVTFLIGVDEARNTSGTQSGDLDPVKGMFWTWNSGYIMAKLEATSPVSTAPANNVELHVGGFKDGESALRLVTFNLDAANSIDIQPNGTTNVLFEADANTWFKRVHEIKIADTPVSTSPGALSMRFADNYAGMFNIVSVNN